MLDIISKVKIDLYYVADENLKMDCFTKKTGVVKITIVYRNAGTYFTCRKNYYIFLSKICYTYCKFYYTYSRFYYKI